VIILWGRKWWVLNATFPKTKAKIKTYQMITAALTISMAFTRFIIATWVFFWLLVFQLSFLKINEHKLCLFSLAGTKQSLQPQSGRNIKVGLNFFRQTVLTASSLYIQWVWIVLIIIIIMTLFTHVRWYFTIKLKIFTKWEVIFQ
jgi:hypothetical protein